MNGQKGNFSGAVNSWLNALPLSETDKDAIWTTFYDAEIPQDEFASRIQPFLENRSDKAERLSQLANWRRQLSELSQPSPIEPEQPGVAEEFFTGMGRTFTGVKDVLMQAAKEATQPESGGVMPSPLSAVARGAWSVARQSLIEPNLALLEKAKEAPTTSESVGYGITAALPIVGPMMAAVGETAPEVAPDWTDPSTYRAAPLARLGGEYAAGYLMGKVTPKTVRAFATEPRETVYRGMQRVRPTTAAKDLARSVRPSRRAAETPERLDQMSQLAIEDMKRGEELLGRKVGAARKNEAGKPIQATSADIYRDAYDATEASMRELGKYMDAYESPDIRPPSVSANQIADDILGARQKSILEESAIPDKEALNARAMYQERADAVRTVPGGQWSIKNIIDEIHNVNKRLQVFEKATQAGRQLITADIDNQYNVLRAYRDALQKARDQALDAVDSQNAKDIYRRYGNLKDWQLGINDAYLKATGESLYSLGELVSDVSFFRSASGAARSALTGNFTGASWQALEAAAVRGAIKATKEAAEKSFSLKKAFEKAKPSTLPDFEKLSGELKEKAGRQIAADVLRESAQRFSAKALPPALADQVTALRQAVNEKRAAYQQAKREVESAQRSLLPEATQLKQELGLTQRPIDMPALSQALNQSYMDYAQALRQLRELEAQQPSLGRTMGVEPGTELVREYPPVAEPFLGGIPEAEVARRATLIPEAPGAVSERYAQQAAAEQAGAASEAALADAQFRQRVEARALADQMAREAELSARADESMFRDIQTRGTTGATRRMGEEQRVFERTQREAEQQQRELSRLEASAKRTELSAAKAQRVQEAEQARKQAEQRLKEAQREEQRRRAELRGAKKAEETPKAEKPEKPKTAEEQALADARAKREQAAAELKASQQAAREARRAPTAETAPAGKTLMFMGQPIRLTGKTAHGYEEFKFVGGPNKGKLGYRKIER